MINKENKWIILKCIDLHAKVCKQRNIYLIIIHFSASLGQFQNTRQKLYSAGLIKYDFQLHEEKTVKNPTLMYIVQVSLLTFNWSIFSSIYSKTYPRYCYSKLFRITQLISFCISGHCWVKLSVFSPTFSLSLCLWGLAVSCQTMVR